MWGVKPERKRPKPPRAFQAAELLVRTGQRPKNEDLLEEGGPPPRSGKKERNEKPKDQKQFKVS